VKATEAEKKDAVEALTKYDMLTDDDCRQRFKGCWFIFYHRGGTPLRRPSINSVCGLLFYSYIEGAPPLGGQALIVCVASFFYSYIFSTENLL